MKYMDTRADLLPTSPPPDFRNIYAELPGVLSYQQAVVDTVKTLSADGTSTRDYVAGRTLGVISAINNISSAHNAGKLNKESAEVAADCIDNQNGKKLFQARIQAQRECDNKCSQYPTYDKTKMRRGLSLTAHNLAGDTIDKLYPTPEPT